MSTNHVSKKILTTMLAVFLFAGCYHARVKPVPANVPRIFTADYDSVLRATLETLDEKGFVVANISKDIGYVSTEMQDNTSWRIKVTVWLSREGGAVKVLVKDFSEQRVQHTASDGRILYNWREEKSSGPYQQKILDEIAQKLDKKE